MRWGGGRPKDGSAARASSLLRGSTPRPDRAAAVLGHLVQPVGHAHTWWRGHRVFVLHRFAPLGTTRRPWRPVCGVGGHPCLTGRGGGSGVGQRQFPALGDPSLSAGKPWSTCRSAVSFLPVTAPRMQAEAVPCGEGGTARSPPPRARGTTCALYGGDKSWHHIVDTWRPSLFASFDSWVNRPTSSSHVDPRVVGYLSAPRSTCQSSAPCVALTCLGYDRDALCLRQRRARPVVEPHLLRWVQSLAE